MRSRFSLLALLIGLVFGARPATADLLVPTDTWSEGNSWQQAFDVGSVVPFDTIAVKLNSDGGGGPFDTPGFSNLPAGWTVTYSSPTLAVASGPERNLILGFNIQFSGNVADSVGFSFAILRDGVFLKSADVDKDHSGIVQPEDVGPGVLWDDPAGDIEQAMVPLPAPFAMAGLGLLCVVFAKRKLERVVG